MKGRVDNTDFMRTDDESREAQRARSIHDMKASLAISNGFSQALESALGDLRESYLSIVQSMDGDISSAQLGALQQHENDCKFCLSRLSSSLQQLKTRIDDSDLVQASHTDSQREDAA